MAKKKTKSPVVKRRKNGSKAGKIDVNMIITLIVGAFLAIFASPMIAKKFPSFSKFTGPLLAGVGVLLATKTKGRKRVAGAGLAVGGAVLGYQSYSVNSAIKAMNGPSKTLRNGPSIPLRNGPSRSYGKRNISNFGSSMATGAPSI